jgi:hypothetical protein
MKIHQLSVTYLGDQDRLLVRVNTTGAEELRLWFTRRLVKGLWPILNQMLADQLVRQEASVTSGAASEAAADDDMKQMLLAHRKGELLEQADFATPYKEEDAVLPLGAVPLLVTEIKMTVGPQAAVLMEFAEQPQEGQPPRGFKVELDTRLLQGLVHLIEQALGHAEWQLADAPAPVDADDESHTDSTTDDPPPRPRYLN